MSPQTLGRREPRALALAAGGQFAFGALQSLVGLLLWTSRPASLVPYLTGATIGCLVAALVLVVGAGRLPWWVPYVGAYIGATCLAVMSDAMWGDDLVVLFVPQLVLIALTVAIFLGRHQVTAFLAYTLVAWAVVCARQADSAQALASWLAVGPSLVIVTIMVRWLVDRLLLLIERDALTGAANRASWDGAVTRAVVGAAAVVLIDLDHFKNVNDTRGHAAGDELLRQVAAAWHHELRQHDTLARLGGDEFAVLAHGTTLPQAVALAEQLRSRVAHLTSVTIGVAERVGDEPLDDVLARADAALYEAKRSGRGCVRAARSPAAEAATTVG